MQSEDLLASTTTAAQQNASPQAATPAGQAVTIHDVQGLNPTRVLPEGFRDFLLGHLLPKIRAGEPGASYDQLPASLRQLLETHGAGEESDNDNEGSRDSEDEVDGDESSDGGNEDGNRERLRE